MFCRWSWPDIVRGWPSLLLASIHRVNRCSVGRVDAKGALRAGTMGVTEVSTFRAQRAPRKCDCRMILGRRTRRSMTRISCISRLATVTMNDLLDGHAALDLECQDFLY